VSKSGILPPPISYSIEVFVYFWAPPSGSSTCSFSLAGAFGIKYFYLGFLMVELLPIYLACLVSFLVFVVGIIDFLEFLASTYFLYIGTFFEIIGTFHFSSHSFKAYCTSSPMTQYLNCSHSFVGSLLSWIHMLCMEALKYAIHWFSLTTYGGILHVVSNFSYIS
jgi:hypothetical protein